MGEHLAMIAQTSIDTDAALERDIAFQAGLLAMAITRHERVAASDEMKRLIAMRSPEQVQRMERERGLR